MASGRGRRRDSLPDPLTFRNVPTGVTGIPRPREWDAVELVDLPELEGSTLAELELDAPVGGEAVARAEEPLPAGVAERLAAELDARLDRPYEALAVRREGGRWAVGARAVRAGIVLDLPDVPASSLEVVRAPGGDLELRADGEDVDLRAAGPYAAAAGELERRAGARFESFVARADKGSDGRWHVTVDPL